MRNACYFQWNVSKSPLLFYFLQKEQAKLIVLNILMQNILLMEKENQESFQTIILANFQKKEQMTVVFHVANGGMRFRTLTVNILT